MKIKKFSGRGYIIDLIRGMGLGGEEELPLQVRREVDG
jgi:hypothetical protein